MKKTFFLSFFLFQAVALEASTAKEKLLASINAFDRGQYQEALKLLADIDIRDDLDDSDDMKMAFRVRAISYAETKDELRAEETIRELLFLDPNYKFDLFDTPALVVQMAQKEKDLIKEKNKHLATLTNIEAPKPAPLILEKPGMGKAFLPFGLNHFYTDSEIKGGIYLSVQSLGLLTNIAAFWWKQSYLNSFGGHRLLEPELRGSFNTAQIMQYVGLGALIGGFVVSVIDALIQFNKTPATTFYPNT